MSNPSEPQTKQLSELLEAANKIVFFTGAGISTESGIPDFRSPGTGLWNKIQPIQFQDFIASEGARRASWRRKFAGDDKMLAAEPNEGHYAVARLIAAGKSLGVITQNVDNLHQQSGIDDAQIIELHGNATYAKCLHCERRYALEPFRQPFLESGQLPACSHCNGIVKTATISFGQAMPELEMQRAGEWTNATDLMIVLGSSLTVYPAAAFPEYAKQIGAKLVIINQQPTSLDASADLVIHAGIGVTLAAALKSVTLATH